MPVMRLHSLDLPLDDKGATTTIAYTEWGDADNPRVLVCVHGLSRNGRDFDFLAAALAEEYRVLCPDMPGRGKSAWLADPTLYSYPTYMQLCRTFLEALHIPRCDWVGTSMGGVIGMMLAAFFPDKINKMVINDIGAIVANEGLKRITAYAGTSLHFATRADAEAHLRSIFAPFGIHEEAHWQHVFAHSIVVENGGFTLAFDPRITDNFRQETENFTRIADIDLSAIWDAVHCPTLLVRGAESDILRAETARAMAQKPDVTLVEWPGIGHAPALMAHEQILVIARWLDAQSNPPLKD